MKKVISVILLTCLALNLATGCSYKKIDEAIKKQIDDQDAPEEITQVPPDENDFTFIEQGGSLPDYYKYSYADYGLPDEYEETGYKGLTYTFNGAKVYDSIKDSPISVDDCSPLLLDIDDDQAYKNNAFILVDMTAKYNNESNDPDMDEIMPPMEFDGTYLTGDGYKEYTEKELDPPYTDPMRVYFSERPKEGDVDIDGNKLDLDSQANVFRKPIKSGKSVDFQVGILVKKDFIDDNNVFMFLRFREPPEKGNPVYLLDLLGRFSNE